MSKNSKILTITLLAIGTCCLVFGSVILAASDGYIGGHFLGIADCGWDDTAVAWIDANENGRRESTESPLPGVKFLVDDIQHDYDTGNEAISDVNGEAWISVFPVDCNGFDNIEIVVEAIAPEGYQPTTPDHIVVPEDLVQNSENDFILFGFVDDGK